MAEPTLEPTAAPAVQKPKFYKEYQGTGSKHADRNGWCWCLQHADGVKVTYLNDSDVNAGREAALKEASALPGVNAADINQVD